ncbi:MAG: LysM peptidoglycan-binding domain-containing protein [Chloroflexota bacterium]
MKEDKTNHPIKRQAQIGKVLVILLAFLAACTKLEPVVVVITATATSENGPLPIEATFTPAPVAVLPSPTNNLPQNAVATPLNTTYEVQAGDTLSGIAAEHGIQLQTLLRVNQISDPNILEVGQVIILPGEPTTNSPDFRIISDSRFVRGPSSTAFDVNSFLSQQKGYIQIASDTVDEVVLSAAEVVQRVATEYSVDPRLLLAVLQYRSQWLTQTVLDDNLKQFPIQGKPSPDGFDRSGLYKQLSWTANQLNAGYYGWKYKGADTLEFDDGTRLNYASNLNAGTIGVQFFFSLQSDYQSWQNAIGSDGLYKTYATLFGDPLAGDSEVLVPQDLQQPELTFPFPSGQTWFFTGGPHGGWGTGSAWSAIDFAPPDDRPDGSPPCYISDYWGTAAAAGVIARSGGGVVILDLDGDGNETTGWTILYLHMASDGRVAEGTHVNIGDHIGRPSCEGGVSNGTHMHIARRYNGEWIPVSCDVCGDDKIPPPPFVLNGWTAVGLVNQEYQGYMTKGSDRRDAEQGRLTPINRVSW